MLALQKVRCVLLLVYRYVMTPLLWYAGALLILAEGLGIVEELV